MSSQEPADEVDRADIRSVHAIQNREPIHDGGYFQHAFYSFAERFDAWVCSWTPRENNPAHTEAARGRELHENLRNEGVEV